MEKFSAAVGELVWISYLCYSQFSNIHTHADLKRLPSSIKLPLIDCLIPVVYKNIFFGCFQTYQRCWPAKFSKIVLLATSKLHTRIKLLHLSTAPHFLEQSHRLPLWGVIIRKHLCLSKENKIYGALKETEPDTGEKSQASGRNAATALS